MLGWEGSILDEHLRYRIFRTENTQYSRFAPPAGYRLAMTQVKIDNTEQCQCCIRIDVGERTRFMAYLGRQDHPREKIQVRLPRPIVGQPDEPITIDVSDQLPVAITISGYELPAEDSDD